MKIIVASTNPVKIEVAKQAFLHVFPHKDPTIIGVSSDSGVPDQPFDDQVLQGAQNRLKNIIEAHPRADYWISQEGGLISNVTDKCIDRTAYYLDSAIIALCQVVHKDWYV
ncbi:MAG: DUF84 family protein [bacterium]